METMEKTAELKLAKFTIEADGKRNNDLAIQCIPNCRLRSRLDPMRPLIDNDGEEMVPKDQARAMSGLPKVPGMRLEVDPAKLTYKITDPLRDNHKLLEQLKKRIMSNDEFGIRTLNERFNGVPEQTGTLDVHRMKSLVWELWHIVDHGNAKLIQGTLPKDKEEIEKMRGKRLLNPGSRVPNTQPRYAEDWDAWVANLSAQGG